MGPQDFYTIYNETPLLTAPAPINGAGQTLAVVQDSNVNPADIATFRSQFGLPTYPASPNNTQGGIHFFNGIAGYCANPGITSGGETEADIDLEWIGAAAPAAIIDFVSCADTRTTFGGDLSALFIVNSLYSSVSAFSESFGECEAQLGSSNSFYDQLWQQAVAEGQTPVVSAGDTGDDVCDFGAGGGPGGADIGHTGLSVSGLASTPYNVAAGGTDFSDNYQTRFNTEYWNLLNSPPPYGTARSYVPEMSWNDSCASTILVDYVRYTQGLNYSNGPEGLCNDTTHFSQRYPFTYLDGGSGGISGIYGQPSWQRGVYGVGLNGNYTSTSHRNLPDVSLFAADGLWGHVLMFCQSDVAPCNYSDAGDDFALSAGGTSFVAPQVAGIMGLINQATSVRQGQANHMFYGLAALEYGTPNAPNVSTSVPSLYTCEGSNVNAAFTYGYGGPFGNCLFYDINRISQYGSNFLSCLDGDNSGCIGDNNDQPCITGTPDCNTNTHGDRYGLLSASNSSFEVAYPQSFGYSAATGLGSVNIANLVLNWQATQGDNTLTVSIFGEYAGVVASDDGYIDCPNVCSHAYPPNTLVTLTAVGLQQGSYVVWSGACSGTGYCNLVMSTNLSLTADIFSEGTNTGNLSLTITGNGTVTSTDGLINCPGPGSCDYDYPLDARVTLTASPASGSSFGGWIGACTGTAPCNVTLTQNYSVTGEFTSPVQFVPVTPCRLVDTRSNNDPIRGGTSRNFAVPQLGGCNIPSTATAYSLNVAVVPLEPLGFLSIWPVGEDQPLVATLNSIDARIKSNAAIVQAGFDGAVSVYATNTTHLILDINGYFTVAGSQTLEFYPLVPCRVVDTRGDLNLPQGLGPPSFGTGESRRLPILSSSCFENLPNQPLAYSFNVAVVPNPPVQPLNYLTLWPSDQPQPYVANLNNPTATVVANAAIAQAATASGEVGDVSVYTYNNTDVIIDTNGYFAAPGSGYSYYPTAPCRVLDTRNNNGPPFTYTLSPPVNPPDSPCGPPPAKAYVVNAAVVPVGSLGYLTLWPDSEQRPVVATLNAYDGFITSNMAIVPSINGSIDAYAYGTTWLILDLSGYFAP